MIFELPIKEIIVNSDSQVRLLEDDGTAYADNDVVAGTSGGFILEGFHGLIMATELALLGTTLRIIKETQTAAAAEVTSYVLTGASAAADTVFRLTVDSLDLTPTVFQNKGYEKRYQIPVQTTIDGVGAAIAAAINADVNAPVVAGYTSGTDTLLITAKEAGQTINLYSEDYVLPAKGTTTAASVGVNNYSNLKNIDWSKNFELDRTSAYYPLAGAEYTSYYFKTSKESPDGGDIGFPTSSKRTTTQDFRLFVREGLTLETALNLLVGDANA
jgi:hypothetical protein